MQRNQQGFTLIELVIVIVILGILSAFALPRFADLGSDARQASLEGAAGAVRSSASIARSAFLAQGEPGDFELDGVEIAMSDAGYPDATDQGIGEAAQLSDDYSFGSTGEGSVEDGDGNALGGTVVIFLEELGEDESCQFTYDASTGRITNIDDEC